MTEIPDQKPAEPPTGSPPEPVYFDDLLDDDLEFLPPEISEEELLGLRGYYDDTYRDYGEVELQRSDVTQCEKARDRVVRGELPTLATKLVVTNERLFDQYDRLHSEVMMRINLAAPLVLLSSALAWRISWWFLFGLLLPVALVRQAATRQRASNDLLIQSVITGAIESSQVDAVRRWVVKNYRKAGAADPEAVYQYDSRASE